MEKTIDKYVENMTLKWKYNCRLNILDTSTSAGSFVKESTCNAGDLGSIPNAGDLGLIPWSGKFPGEGNGNPFKYSCLKNPTDRGTWQATVHAVAMSQT